MNEKQRLKRINGKQRGGCFLQRFLAFGFGAFLLGMGVMFWFRNGFELAVPLLIILSLPPLYLAILAADDTVDSWFSFLEIFR